MPDKPKNVQKTRQPDPTPEEIAAETAKIRATWTEDDYRRRQVGRARAAWQVPGSEDVP